MTMDVMPIRLPKGLIKQVDGLVRSGDYSSRSDVVRDAIRKLVARDALQKLVGLAPGDGIDSTKRLRKVRDELSKEIKSEDDIKKIDELYG